VLICGVDDAGRGSLLGPLVIAGVLIKRSKIKKLSSMGVRDSKKLSPRTREKLYKKIIDYADNYYVAKIYPKTIDSSCDVNPKRFGKKIAKLSNSKKIRSYHHADSRFVIVSAASIIAKVNRDKSIARLRKKHDLGSGYPSDSKTIKFVSNYISSGKEIPNFVRKSWKPVKILLG